MTIKRLLALLTAVMLLFTVPAALAQQAPVAFDVAAYISSVSGLDLAPFRGRTVMLHFFTAGGAECQAQLPILKMLRDDFDAAGLEIVLIHVQDGETAQDAEAALAACGLEGVTLYEDENCALSSLLGVTAYPNTLILGKDGSPASGYGGLISYPTLAAALEMLNVRRLGNSYQAE